MVEDIFLFHSKIRIESKSFDLFNSILYVVK